MATAMERRTQVEKQLLVNRPGYRYAALVDDRGTTLSIHDDVVQGLLWVSSFDAKGSPRAFRGDLAQAIALWKALGLWLADHDHRPEPQHEHEQEYGG